MQRVTLALLLLPSLPLAAAGQAAPLGQRPVPLAEARITAPHLRRRVIGCPADGLWPFYGLDYNAPGNQVGERLRLAQPSWLESVSFSVAQCSYDSLWLRVQVYALADGLPAAPLLPPTVAVRLARRDLLRQRVTLDLQPYGLRLTGDVVVALELLRAQGPGTLLFSAAHQPGPLYKLDRPGDGTCPNRPPVGTQLVALPWRPVPASPWRTHGGLSVGISAVVLQEGR